MWRGKFASKIVDVLDEGVGEGEGDDDVGFAVQKTLSKEVLDVFRSIREELRESEAMMENAVDGSAIDMEENPVTVIPGYQVGRVDNYVYCRRSRGHCTGQKVTSMVTTKVKTSEEKVTRITA